MYFVIVSHCLGAKVAAVVAMSQRTLGAFAVLNHIGLRDSAGPFYYYLLCFDPRYTPRL